MWPKLIAQLWELLPHASRLIPVAQKYFEQRGTNDAETLVPLRNAVTRVSDAHEAMARQMEEQTHLLAELTNEARELRSMNGALSRRLDVMETAAASAALWAKIASAVALVTVLLAVMLLLKH